MSTLKTDLIVRDVMMPLDKVPVVSHRTMFKDALDEMGKVCLGIICITDSGGKLKGIFTDGDLRRLLITEQKPMTALFCDDIITHSIKKCATIASDSTLIEAVEIMEKKQIWDLPVVTTDGKLLGMLHLHPVVKKLLGL
ncbi:MAG: CBS domain-containing protein [Magnetococcales bacterium]|nr:CBS domain-containing protein [Magnetococcales bacterium]